MPKFRLKKIISPRARAISRADAARDDRNPAIAAQLYGEVLDKWGPSHALLMQFGNALKDCGEFTNAERAYRDALALRPDEADTFLQYGHLMKLSGRHSEAEDFYRKALELDPALLAAHREIDAIMADRAAADAEQRASVEIDLPRLSIRTDMPLPAAIIYCRLVNSHRWRRG